VSAICIYAHKTSGKFDVVLTKGDKCAPETSLGHGPQISH